MYKKVKIVWAITWINNKLNPEADPASCWVNMPETAEKAKAPEFLKSVHARDPNVQIFAGPLDSFSKIEFCPIYGLLSEIKGFITQQWTINSLVNTVGNTVLIGKYVSIRYRNPHFRQHHYSVIQIK